MKKLLLFFSVLSCTGLFAQYGNEWINFSQQYYKLKVYEDGVYKITHQTLVDAGVPVSSIQGSNYVLYNMGQQGPIYVTTNSAFSSGDFIEFFGKMNDGTFDRALYGQAGWQPNPFLSLFTDTAAYYLTWNTSTNNERITAAANSTSAQTPESYCIYRFYMDWSNGLIHESGQPHTIGTSSLYSSAFEKGEGFISNGYHGTKPYSTNIPTPFYFNGSGKNTEVVVSEVGYNNNPHHLIVNFGGVNLIDTSFSAYNHFKFRRGANINLGNTTLFEFMPQLTKTDKQALYYLEIKYPRVFNAADENNTFQPTFEFELANSGSKYLEISGFNDNGTTPILYDLTNKIRMEGILGGSLLKYLLPGPTTTAADRHIFITNQHGSILEEISTLTKVDFIDYTQLNEQGHYIILTHHSLLDGGWVEDYRQYRSTADQDAIIVLIDQLYDQFGYGIAKHPLSVKNFAFFALDNWDKKPSNLFIIGKGTPYVLYGDGHLNTFHDTRDGRFFYNSCLVPTYGAPPSDVQLTAPYDSYVPQIPTGRLAATTTDHIRLYLKKVEEYEDVQANPSDSISEMIWQKHAMHFGGGANESQQKLFRNYLTSYEHLWMDTLHGGKVFSLYKTSGDPIQPVESEKVLTRINDGLSLMTFFGHSTSNSFDFNLDHPSNYNNQGKYPLIISNGCYSGLIHDPFVFGVSEKFVLIEDRGAIGFLSATALGLTSALNKYTWQTYYNMCQVNYGETLGTNMQKTIEHFKNHNANAFDRITSEQMTLHGDPALKVNNFAKPDYAIERSKIYFDPLPITVKLDSFDLNVIVTNIGRAIADSFEIEVTRTLPSGQSTVLNRTVKATHYIDTFTFTFPIDPVADFGLNNFSIRVDALSEIDETSEFNNDILNGIFMNILSDDILPIYPYEFSIVSSDEDLALKASTANVFGSLNDYLFEMDTSELFLNPLASVKIPQSGGVVEWQPGLTLQNNTVYYWRVKYDNPEFEWHTSSFIHIDGSSPGWNQSHFYQFQKDNYSNVQLDSNRVFNFLDDLKVVECTNGILGYGLENDNYDLKGYYLNSNQMYWESCLRKKGFVFAVFDPITGLPWISETPGQYGNNNCWGIEKPAFEFKTSNDGAREATRDFISLIPDGHYVLAYNLKQPDLPNWDTATLAAFQSLGCTMVDTFNLPETHPYLYFGKKNDPSYLGGFEKVGDSAEHVVTLKANFTTQWYQGSINSTLIGPAAEWGSVHWSWQEHPELASAALDTVSLEVIAYGTSDTQAVYKISANALDTTLDFIDASLFPFIQLQFNTNNDSLRKSAQLNYWRVLYDPVPEAALNPNATFAFYDDTITAGEDLTFKVAVQNVSHYDMDSLLIRYQVTNHENNIISIPYPRQDSLRKLDSMHTQISINTNGYSGLNALFIEVNPNKDQPEQFHFNNVGMLLFYVNVDEINPLLDVTFDGRHILDGDIVSAKPEIQIKLKDENEFLALDTNSLLSVFLKYPDGNLRAYEYDNQTLRFIPATINKKSGKVDNTAEIEFNPILTEDGTYELLVQGRDKTGNPAGAIDYKISFEVINKPTITHVMNYPNPFTTATHFVFTLTGSELPNYFKIQIMTISGKIVKEIPLSELGEIYIGRNVTEYAWNGTDQYGDRLANGVYLYRVVTHINKNTLEHRATEADQYFTKGFGKMYLIR